jgi:hypothetical protein
MVQFHDKVKQDCLQAAKEGLAEAHYRARLMYSTGQGGGHRDLVSAYKWSNLAALRGSGAARQVRREVAADMTQREVAEAQRQAREWLRGH